MSMCGHVCRAETCTCRNVRVMKCPYRNVSCRNVKVPKRWEAVYIPVADGTTATQSQDEHGLTFEEFSPTETPSDF